MQTKLKPIIKSVKERNNCIRFKDNDNNPLLDGKIDLITAGLPPRYPRALKNEVTQGNALIICEFILALKTEINLSDNYRRSNIDILRSFSRFHRQKPFTDIPRDDVLAFLDSLRKPESLDPMHKWIGTYNLYMIQLVRFFKWLYSPDIEPGKRAKPEVVENISQLRRKEKSVYK
ncbi:MAG TPA: hypothetical protein VE548_07450, partial [Nitrososphaeraceae archaeon]|nr:hypothetical protein [Nitrososphaeraceae archaeon]